MRYSDICNNADIGFNGLSQDIYLSAVVHTHFDYGCRMFIFKRKNRDRNAYIIIKIPFCLMHIVFLRQNACYNIFCRRFSDASRYRNNGYVEQTSVPFS